jgi:hypothetical protein
MMVGARCGSSRGDTLHCAAIDCDVRASDPTQIRIGQDCRNCKAQAACAASSECGNTTATHSFSPIYNQYTRPLFLEFSSFVLMPESRDSAMRPVRAISRMPYGCTMIDR